MITEFALAGLGTYLWNYWNTTDERKIKNTFKEIMIKSGIKNKEDETFKIYKITKTSYGYMAYISNIKGLSLEHINSKINILEDNMNGIVTVEKDRFKNYIKMKIINKDIDKYIYAPVKTNENEIYIGKQMDAKGYLVDLNKEPMILIAGATGTGKSMLLAIIITNIIYNNSNKIDMYLLQISKSELSSFENCTCVKEVSYDLIGCTKLLMELYREINKRSEKFKARGIRNLSQWNKHYPKEYMKRKIVVIEEISFFMNCENPNVWEYICGISKAGRSVGINIITTLQRTTADCLDTTTKSQMSRITFRQKSVIDSNNVINTTDAVRLKERECIFDGNSDYIQVKTPYIDDDFIILNKYVPEIKIPTEEDKQEILNIKKINEKVICIEEPQIIDIAEKDIQVLGSHGNTTNKTQDKNTNRADGIMTLEEFKNAKRKR